MGSQGDAGDNNGKHSQLQPLVRQNSMYSLTLDEVQNQLGDLGKPLSSMNLDELLKTVWTVEANQSKADIEGTAQAGQATLQRQASLSLTSTLSSKTVDEVWRDIQQSKDDKEKKSRSRQPTLGEMTLEDFLVKAGVVAEAASNRKNTRPTVGADANIAAPQHGPWIQYPQPQYQHPQQGLMGIYVPSQNIAQPLHMGGGATLDVPYVDGEVALSSPMMGALSDTKKTGRKRGTSEDMVEKTVERRQKRMIKNRESAARSRARKQAYTTELENKVSRLEEENEKLRRQKELEKMLSSAPPPEPRYQLRRTSSASF
ncbi:ABSCISIC ACID-INSENSITIVE 5-like protein 2 [Abrus precatorius]|uniref:ABSCISIC ACID-INSENSITIVE 5-like protein 2 n=1 Tax=Abrus precatorius TaxID=3816 RepID=A0A8B8KJ22_ABRPR|nr:ABSCISIC ACID-INSENSITIVE 5-like protein 2 [Abrus precatorius]